MFHTYYNASSVVLQETATKDNHLKSRAIGEIRWHKTRSSRKQKSGPQFSAGRYGV
jgi:hypothetical protein